MLPASAIEHYARDGYVVLRELFSKTEAEGLLNHLMSLKEAGFDPGEDVSHLSEDDPLRIWQRFMHPHRRDERTKRWMLDPRIGDVLRDLFQDEPLAAQTMVYFKPPGGRGHALHQDQYYLRVDPGTCMGVWMALDRADPENGGMRVVPGFGNLPLLCVQPADDAVSWSQVTCPLPDEAQAVELELEPGDTLFFNGWVPHGSLPNRSLNRFRRCMIGHYIPASAKQVSSWYHPLVNFDGEEVTLEPSIAGGACGVWKEGEVEMIDPETHQPVLLHE